jgi:hypothetical protein
VPSSEADGHPVAVPGAPDRVLDRFRTDRTRWTLDDRLASALRRLEHLADEAEERRVEQGRREAERERQPELERVEAGRRRIESPWVRWRLTSSATSRVVCYVV